MDMDRNASITELDQRLRLEEHDDGVNDLGNSVVPQIDSEISVGGWLVGCVDTWDVFDLSVPGPLVESSTVDSLTVLERRGDMDKEVVSTWTGNVVLEQFSGCGKRSDGGGDDGGTGFCEFRSDETDSSEV